MKIFNTARPSSMHPTYVKGFSLIELMVTITVGGLLLGLAMPSFTTFIQNNRLSTQAASLVAGLNYARSEAIKRGDTTGVTVSAASGTNWSQGWTIFYGTAPGTTLQTVGPLLTGTTLKGTNAGTAVGSLVFLADGSVKTSPLLVFTFCDTRGATYAREVEVNAGGRIQGSSKPGLAVSNPAITLTCP